jgi:hypothetical protein
MIKRIQVLLVATLAAGQFGCANLASVSLTSIPANRSQVVKAESSRLIVLGINFDNDYVDRLVTDLKQQCNDGRVTGILTKDEVILYLSVFLWRRRVTAEGFCVRSVAQNSAGKRGVAGGDEL